MKVFLITEFKPSIVFLIKFVGLYLICNVLYGWYVTSYLPSADPVTVWITEQTATALNWLTHKTEVINHPKKPTAILVHQAKSIVSVYEGCNGINIAIIFTVFIFSFGPFGKKMFWFIPVGIIAIHVFNIFRIAGLFLITLYKPGWLYFTHKYMFTAFIYGVVFGLWLLWVKLNAFGKRQL